MNSVKLSMLVLILIWSGVVVADSSINVCAYREEVYVDTLDRLALGASITTFAASVPVVVEMTAAGLAVVSAPVSVPVAVGVISAATLFRGLNSYCVGSQPSIREMVTDTFCGVLGDCAEYWAF